MNDRLSAALSAAVRGAILGIVLGVLGDFFGIRDILGIRYDYYLGIATGIGFLIGLLRRDRWLQWGIVGSGVLVMILAFTPVANLATRALVRRDAIVAPIDAILVLSGTVNGAGTINPEATDRLLTGLELHQQIPKADFVVSWVTTVTGDHRVISSRMDQQRLIHLADSTLRALHVDSVRATHDEAVRMFALGHPRGWKRVAVVTTSTHTRRACAVFERVGFQVVCVPSRWSKETGESARGRILLFQDWLYETLAWWDYRARGWV